MAVPYFSVPDPRAIPEPFPQTKPATEFIGGRLVQKMSPLGLHAGVQLSVASALRAWAHEHGMGRVGTEWDCDLTPAGEQVNRLVPDIAYLSYERVSYEDDAGASIPKVAPNVVVEVLSPGQNVRDLAEKVRIFLASGCELVVLIDPRAEYALLYDALGAEARRIEGQERLFHPALPGFDAKLSSFFEKPKPKKPT